MPDNETEPAPQASAPDEVALGRIAGVFGIRGEVKLEPYADFPARYNTLKTVTARFPDGQSRLLSVAGARKHKTHILMRFDGIATPEDAGTLRDATLFIPFAERAELPKDHYYVSDLIGMDVVSTTGETVGQITEVLHTKAHDIYVTPRLMIPAVRAFIRAVDPERRRVVVANLDQLLEGTEG